MATGTVRGGFAQAEPGHRLCERPVRRGCQWARALCLPDQREQCSERLSIQCKLQRLVRGILAHRTSSNAGGLIRWPVKLILPVGFALMALQGVFELISASRRSSITIGRSSSTRSRSNDSFRSGEHGTNISECEFPTGTAAILGIEYRSFFYPLFRNDSRPYPVDRRRNRRLMQHGKEPSLIASLYR